MRDLKRFLKRVGVIERLNRRLKAQQVVQNYERTCRYYARRCVAEPPGRLLSCRIEQWRARCRIESDPSIYFLGTDEDQDRSGFLQALERIGSLRWFSRADGSYGQNDPAPPRERIANNTARLEAHLRGLAESGWTPDVLIAQTWATAIEPNVLTRIRHAYGTFVINIAMDDRHQYWGGRQRGSWSGTYPLIPHLDLALTSASECAEWYEKEGCPALFFPMASDPELFRPMPELQKTHDLSFVGGRYGIREKIVQGLRQAGVRVSAFGSGWEGGRIDTSEVPRLFAQSKIVLGVGTIGHCEDFYALKLRDFDGPMSGSLYLTHDNVDLHRLFDVGAEILTYRSIEECIVRARRVLDHPDERERVAQAGRLKAVRDHTWDRRFTELFGVLLGSGTVSRVASSLGR